MYLHSGGGVNGERGASLHGLRVSESIGGTDDLRTQFVRQIGDEMTGPVAGMNEETRQRGHEQDGEDEIQRRRLAMVMRIATAPRCRSSCCLPFVCGPTFQGSVDPLQAVDQFLGEALADSDQVDGWRYRSVAARRW